MGQKPKETIMAMTEEDPEKIHNLVDQYLDAVIELGAKVNDGSLISLHMIPALHYTLQELYMIFYKDYQIPPEAWFDTTCDTLRLYEELLNQYKINVDNSTE